MDQSWFRRLAHTEIDYVVVQSFTHDTGLEGGDKVLINEGFVFNCSIPRFLRWLLDPHDPRYLRASAVHDMLLKLGMDRRRAGAEFEAVLRGDGVRGVELFAMWLAVSSFKFFQ